MAFDRISTKTEDFLTEDPAIRGQQYCCLSFVSPDDVIVKKDADFFNQFLGGFSADVGILFDNLIEKFKDNAETSDMFVNLKNRYDYIFNSENLQEEFHNYKAMHTERLEREYLERNNFQTSMRGIKIRGSYETIAEAQKRANQIKQFDPNFDVFVAQVGCWCPWAPNPQELQDQEYAETELNTLVKKYKENAEKKDEFHRLRVDDMKAKAHAQKTVIVEEVVPPLGEANVDIKGEAQAVVGEDVTNTPVEESSTDA